MKNNYDICTAKSEASYNQTSPERKNNLKNDRKDDKS